MKYIIIFLSSCLLCACSKDDVNESQKIGEPEAQSLMIGELTNTKEFSINKSINSNTDGKYNIPIDLDNDQTLEFDFIVSQFYYGCAETEYSEEAKIACSSGTYNSKYFFNTSEYEIAVDKKGFPLKLNEGDLLNDDLTWVNKEWNTLFIIDNETGGGIGSMEGNWSSFQKAYLGLRNTSENKVFFGWVEIKNNYSNFSVERIVLQQ